MNDQRDALETLHNDLFERQCINHLTFENEIPEALTADKYLLMYKKIWAVIRHDLYRDIQRKKKEKMVDVLEEKDFNELYELQHKNFEKIRLEVYQ